MSNRSNLVQIPLNQTKMDFGPIESTLVRIMITCVKVIRIRKSVQLDFGPIPDHLSGQELAKKGKNQGLTCIYTSNRSF